MKRITAISLLLLGIAALAAYPVKITSWHVKEDVKKLNALHISVDYVNVATQTILVDVPNDIKYQTIVNNGFQTEIIPDQAKEYASKLWNDTKDSRDPMRNYLSLTEYQNFMQTTATTYPAICQLVQYGTTPQNHPLYFMKISDNVTIEENEPEFRFMSSIHGNEVVGFDMCIRMIQLLTSQYGTNTRITNIVNNTELWIGPLYNPDGYALQQRYNAAGIDLNRNFPMPSGNQHPDGEVWAAENIAIMNFSDAHSINLSSIFHGGELVVNYLWDYTTTVCPDNSLVVQGALAYADHNPGLHNSTSFPNGITEGGEWYIIDGSLQDWLYGYNDEINYTIEIGTSMWPPDSQLASYWADNQESMLSFCEFVQRGVNGTVTNTDGVPLDATITIANNAKVMHTDPDVGDYHRLLLPGNYLVTAAATGYLSQSGQVTVPATGAITHNFVLESAATVNFTGAVINNLGNPVPGALVNLISTTGTAQNSTNAQGHFTIPGVFIGNYNLVVTADGLGTIYQDFLLTAESNYQLIVLNPPLFTDNFETGAGNWTLSSPWAVVANGVGHVLTDSPSGNYGNNLNLNAVLTNPINLQNISNPTLSFDIKYALESGYDFLKVQGSTNGTSWTDLASYSGTQTAWINVSLPLTTYANQSFRLRFRLVSDYGQTADGVYIDNVAIAGNNTTLLSYGDVDGTKLINFTDAQDVLDYSVGNNPIPVIDPRPWETNRLEAADVDNDNTVTALDAYIIADKVRNYTGSFPVQGGTTYTFNNPNLALQYLNGSIHLMADNPENLFSMQLGFSAENTFTLGDIEWSAQNQCLTALNAGTNTIGMVNPGLAPLNANLADVDFTTTSMLVHCTGFVNGVAFSQDISLVGNDDNNATLFQNKLYGNYPNPFNPQTTIRFSVQKDHTPVQVIICNAKGQTVRTMLQTDLNKGMHIAVFDGKDAAGKALGNGIYFVRMLTPDKIYTHKMVMLK